jgi:hypothetical protein
VIKAVAQPSEPAIRLVDYMGDYDDYYATNLIGPYVSQAARDVDLARLRSLPLGAPEYNGGYEFLPATMGAAGADACVAEPERVTRAGTVREFFAAFFHGWAGDEDGGQDPVHPDQTALIS